MKLVTIKFVIRDEEEDGFDHELRHSGLLSDWYCFGWSIKPATVEQIEWHEREHDGNHHE